MKTIKFDCNGHNAPAYSCNKPYDNSGEYVPADVAQGLYDALRDMVSSHEVLGSPLPLSREVEVALDALDAADGECES